MEVDTELYALLLNLLEVDVVGRLRRATSTPNEGGKNRGLTPA